MARMARIKVEGEATAYHVYGRIAGVKEIMLFLNLCAERL